ncbi:MAG: FHA domain-containing protein [Pyrinomonadaceae bacterium]|nr:FHA domain-containing protein [Pyrinomonadaceae bacterium]
MPELFLKFKDVNGDERIVAVDKNKFAIGRHSSNDLTIADSRLSREHLLIERFGDVFVVSERGSSNGSKLDGEILTDPTALTSNCRLELGGFYIDAEFRPDEPDAPPEAEPPAVVAEPQVAAAPSPGSIPTSFFYIAPVIAVLILLGVGLVVLMSGGNGKRTDRDIVISDDPIDEPVKKRTPAGAGTPSGNSGDAVTVSPTPPGNTELPTATPTGDLTETAKLEENAKSFLRAIAQNDKRGFITGANAQVVAAKIATVRSGPALADNIASARKSSSQIRTLAQSKNLKPQLLAAAAITKLGSQRGDVLQTAQSMADTLDKLSVQVGNELGDDCLLMIAAYDQGASGDFMRMRNMLQKLSTDSPQLVREIRTIWYLKKNGKITDSEYEFALRFLAIGTIMQNPKAFGVNTEAPGL